MKTKFFDCRGSWEFSNVKEIVINEKGTTVTYIDIYGEEHQETGDTPDVIINGFYGDEDEKEYKCNTCKHMGKSLTKKPCKECCHAWEDMYEERKNE